VFCSTVWFSVVLVCWRHGAVRVYFATMVCEPAGQRAGGEVATPEALTFTAGV